MINNYTGFIRITCMQTTKLSSGILMGKKFLFYNQLYLIICYNLKASTN